MNPYKHIVIIVSEFPPQPGGIGTHGFDLAVHFTNNGYRVSVVTEQRSETGEEEALFDSKQPFKIFRSQRKKPIVKTYLQRCLLAKKATKTADYIIVSGKFSLWMVPWLKWFKKAPITAVIHATEVQLAQPQARKLTNYSLKKCTSVIAVSNYTASLVKHLELNKLEVIPNGITVQKEKYVRPEKTPKNIKLITVGNITQRKGQHNVVAALPKLLNQFPTLEYHCVGLPTEAPRLVTLANELKVGHALKIHGRVSDEIKIQLLKEATVFIMLSEVTPTGDAEGFGIAILEANALGLPAIGAKGCGIEDAINKSKSGLLISNNDPVDCVDAVTNIMASYSNYIEGATHWAARFNWEDIIKKYINHIK